MKLLSVCIITVLLLAFVGCTTPAATNDPTATTTSTTAKTTAPLPSVGWTTADSMRVRGEARLKAEVIGGIVFGTKVEILGKQGDWYEIRFGDGTGFISGQYITFTDPALSNATTAP